MDLFSASGLLPALRPGFCYRRPPGGGRAVTRMQENVKGDSTVTVKDIQKE